jgi:hypothetical protein
LSGYVQTLRHLKANFGNVVLNEVVPAFPKREGSIRTYVQELCSPNLAFSVRPITWRSSELSQRPPGTPVVCCFRRVLNRSFPRACRCYPGLSPSGVGGAVAPEVEGTRRRAQNHNPRLWLPLTLPLASGVFVGLGGDTISHGQRELTIGRGFPQFRVRHPTSHSGCTLPLTSHFKLFTSELREQF